MATISYAILVNDELEEIKQLLEFLIENKEADDEIVVLMDFVASMSVTLKKLKTHQYVTKLAQDLKIKLEFHPLNKDFSKQKNYLNSKCVKDYIFNIDADELLTAELIANIHPILEQNPDIELFWLPRVNKVEGITPEHIVKWGWRVDENGDVNYPDWQPRVYKNIERIKWVKPVHERLVGMRTMTNFPADKSLALLHYKTIDRQEKQNLFYSGIQRI